MNYNKAEYEKNALFFKENTLEIDIVMVSIFHLFLRYIV